MLSEKINIQSITKNGGVEVSDTHIAHTGPFRLYELRSSLLVLSLVYGCDGMGNYITPLPIDELELVVHGFWASMRSLMRVPTMRALRILEKERMGNKYYEPFRISCRIEAAVTYIDSQFFFPKIGIPAKKLSHHLSFPTKDMADGFSLKEAFANTNQFKLWCAIGAVASAYMESK